ncbi:MAG: hypothetical protein ACYCUI_01765 [Vulcanimicrobiaceae bacterium]
MPRYIFASAALAGMLLAVGCGGGGAGAGGGSGSVGGSGGVLPQSEMASGSVTFLIPIKGQLTKPLGTTQSRNAQAHLVRPLYVSPETSSMSLLIDGHSALNDFQIPDLGTDATPPPNTSGSFTLADGQTGTYAFALGNGSSQGYYVATINLTLVPGPHTIGVVLQDTPANNNFVLSEGQTNYTLASGSNAPATLYLRGVMDSGFLCDATCDGNIGPLQPDGSANIEAFVCDEGGWCMPYQVESDNVTPVLFDNGSYSIQECDTIGGSRPTETCSGNTGIVELTGCGTGASISYDPAPPACVPQPSANADGSLGPFTYPGQYQVENQVGTNCTSASTPLCYVAGELVNIRCLKQGTTNVAMVADATDPSTGSVTGFTYTSTNYPTTPDQIFGAVPAYPSFGNHLAVNCTANLALTVQ